MRKKYFIHFFAAIALSLGVSSCTDGPDCPNKDDRFEKTPLYEINMTSEQTRAVAAIQKGVASQIYSLIEKSETSENVCYSPFSFQIAFSMFLHDSESEIKNEDLNEWMDFFGTKSLKDLEQLNGVLLTELPKVDGRIKFTLANSIWNNSDINAEDQNEKSWEKTYESEKFFLSFKMTILSRKSMTGRFRKQATA